MFSASARAPRLVLRRGAPYAGSVVAGAVGYHALQQEETAGQLGPLLVAEALAALSSNVLGASPATTAQTVGFVAKVADFWGVQLFFHLFPPFSWSILYFSVSLYVGFILISWTVHMQLQAQSFLQSIGNFLRHRYMMRSDLEPAAVT